MADAARREWRSQSPVRQQSRSDSEALKQVEEKLRDVGDLDALATWEVESKASDLSHVSLETEPTELAPAPVEARRASQRSRAEAPRWRDDEGKEWTSWRGSRSSQSQRSAAHSPTGGRRQTRVLGTSELRMMIRDGESPRHSSSGRRPSLDHLPVAPPELSHQEEFVGDLELLEREAERRAKTVEIAKDIFAEPDAPPETAFRRPASRGSRRARLTPSPTAQSRVAEAAAAAAAALAKSSRGTGAAHEKESDVDSASVSTRMTVERDDTMDAAMALIAARQAIETDQFDARREAKDAKDPGAPPKLTTEPPPAALTINAPLAAIFTPPQSPQAPSIVSDSAADQMTYRSDVASSRTVESGYYLSMSSVKGGTTAADRLAAALRREKERLETGSVPRKDFVNTFRHRRTRSNSWEHGTVRSIFGSRRKSAALVVALGIIAASIDYTIDECIRQLANLKAFLVDLGNGAYPQLAVSAALTASMAVASAAMVKYYSPLAAGSGIAEAKYLLGGDVINEAERLLTPRMLLAKITGLTLAAGSGMIVGREGPFVHTSIALANFLIDHLPSFKDIKHNGTIKRQVFAAACAVGVSSTFSSPIGGLLFSIEVTSTYYLVANYWKGFLCSVCGALVVKVIIRLRFDPSAAEEPFFDTDLDGSDFDFQELPLFALIGALMGGLGTLYVRIDSMASRFMRPIVKPVPGSFSLTAAAVLGIVTAVAYFYSGEFNNLNLFEIVSDLVSTDPLPDRWNLRGQDNSRVALVLFVFLSSRLLLTVLTTNLAIPSGNFIPVFTIGLAFGRLFAEVLNTLFDYEFSPAGYAVCAGAALAASVTHTISTAVIVMEVTGALDYQLPVFLSVMVSYGVAQYIGESIYDVKMKAKNFRFLPPLQGDSAFSLSARDVMETSLSVLSRRQPMRAVVAMLKEKSFSAVAVVDNHDTMVFLGCVSRRALLRHLYYHALKRHVEDELRKDLPTDFTDEVVHEMEIAMGHKVKKIRNATSSLRLPFFYRTGVQKYYSLPKKRRRERRRSIAGGEMIQGRRLSLTNDASDDGEGLPRSISTIGHAQSAAFKKSISSDVPRSGSAMSDGVLRDEAKDAAGPRSPPRRKPPSLLQIYEPPDESEAEAKHAVGAYEEMSELETPQATGLGSAMATGAAYLGRLWGATFGGGEDRTERTSGAEFNSFDAEDEKAAGKDAPKDDCDLYKELLDSHTVHLRTAINAATSTEVIIDPSPFRVSEYMPVEQVHILFEMLRCTRVFVTSYGILVGVISRGVLEDALNAFNTTLMRPAPKRSLVNKVLKKVR